MISYNNDEQLLPWLKYNNYIIANSDLFIIIFLYHNN